MYDKILVPFDGSACSERALVEAARLAGLCSASLRLLHVIDPIRHITGFEQPEIYTRDILPALRKAGEAMLAKARESTGPVGANVETEVIESLGARVSEVIVDEAQRWGAGVIVLGTHGRRGVNRVLMGSDAEQVARTSPVPVLLLRCAE